MEKNKISIVVPCFNEKEALPLFYNKITQVFNQMSQESETAGLSYELIIVDDGSSDGTLDVAKELATNDSGVKYISFSRNFGKEAAMYAGLQHAVGEYVAIMDADLQDPPEMLPKMYQVLTKEGYDAVGTRRVTRKGEPPIRSFFARKFYRLMSRISKANMVDGARDYRLMNRKYVDALLSLKEYNRFSKGLFGWVGFKVKWLEFENVERVAGERLLVKLPESLRSSYEHLVLEDDPEVVPIVKAADKLSAHIKCLEEQKAGNTEFDRAAESTLESINALGIPEAEEFMKEFLDGYRLTLDEIKE